MRNNSLLGVTCVVVLPSGSSTGCYPAWGAVISPRSPPESLSRCHFRNKNLMSMSFNAFLRRDTVAFLFCYCSVYTAHVYVFLDSTIVRLRKYIRTMLSSRKSTIRTQQNQSHVVTPTLRITALLSEVTGTSSQTYDVICATQIVTFVQLEGRSV